MSQEEFRARTPEQAKRLHQLGVELVVGLNAGLKSARIYEPNNELFRRQAGYLLDLIHATQAEFGESHLAARSSTLFYNNLRLKYGPANYHFFKFLIDALKKIGTGGLKFGPETSETELKQFLVHWAKADRQAQAGNGTLKDRLGASGVAHITLDEVDPCELAGAKERAAAKVYFLGISFLEETFQPEDSGEKIRLSTTRRLIQSIFNHIVDNESFVQGLTNIKNFHEYTLNHSMNVCVLAIALGRRLGLDRNELVDLGISAFFHDFGKLDTPKEILEKPARLDDQERQIIEKHPHQGAAKLVQYHRFKNLPLRAIRVALEHHVKEDLGGYPRYFRKTSSNLFSKIVKIVDFFDAVTTKRVYRANAFTREEAIQMMLERSGTEFHPALLREFVKMMGVYPVGSLVLLNTGEVGIVVENNPEIPFLLRPKVRLITDAERNKMLGETIDLSAADEAGKFPRSIVKTLNPDEYGVRVEDYFLVQAQ